MSFLKRLFNRPKVDFKELIKNGAIVIDVRTSAEFKSGHIKGAKNIPLNTITGKLKGVKQDQVIIAYCASGMRSASAVSILKANGYTAYNGRGFRSLQTQLS